MKCFASFLRRSRYAIIAVLVTAAAFSLSMALYGMEFSAVAYPLIVCGAVCAVMGAAAFFRYKRKYDALYQLCGEILISLENLPDPDDDNEERYQELLETLFLEKNVLSAAADKRYDDLTVYFSLWAHQIKTPITALSLALQSAEFSEKDEFSEYLQRIEQYVEMALCYVQLDSDNSDLVIREHSLDDIVKQAIRRFSKQFIRRKLTLVYEPSDITVLTDEKLLLFVIEQLISNALKYTPRGSIEIALEPADPPVLTISDTGIGIASEDLPRIFERGFTGSNGRTDKRATGIGLYLCKRICERLGYSIVALSNSGGTQVRVTLCQPHVDTRE